MRLVDRNKSTEWYTPPIIIAAAREVLGTIDLDPASSPDANKIVQAARFYTVEDNGLALPWSGNVWLNPPYGRDTFNKSSQENWIKTLLRYYASGDIQQAILLSTSDTDEKWFRPLWQFLICFVDHHVWFHRPGLPREKQMFGTCLIYLGTNEQRFAEVFSSFGPVVKTIAKPKRSENLHLPEIAS